VENNNFLNNKSFTLEKARYATNSLIDAKPTFTVRKALSKKHSVALSLALSNDNFHLILNWGLIS
jgi:hypothetical protein